jgi:hypothetical protein
MSTNPAPSLFGKIKTFWRFYKLNRLIDKHRDRLTLHLNYEVFFLTFNKSEHEKKN